MGVTPSYKARENHYPHREFIVEFTYSLIIENSEFEPHT